VPDATETEKTVPLAEERLSVQKRTVETGRVRITTVVDEKQQWIRETLARDDVLIERVPIGREVETAPQIHEEADTLVIPVLEEILVVSKRLVLKEELHVRRQRRLESIEEPVTLKSMRAVVERDGPGQGDPH
jgi:uncharacterized protein (TIGR02271 family)